MPPPILVPGTNVQHRPVLKGSHELVQKKTSLFESQLLCIGELVRKVYARQEILVLNAVHHM